MNTFRIVIILFSFAVLPCFQPTASLAAEEECVGTLALAVRDDVAVQLKLTSDQKTRLQELIDRRENDAIGLAMQYRDLSTKERFAKMAPFRKESETLGKAILTPEQQAKLEQIRIRRLGLSSLADPVVVEKFGLSDAQKKEVADILERREKDLTKADEKTARIIQAQTEHELAAVLNEKQKSAWEAISGGEPPRAELPTSREPKAVQVSQVEKTSAANVPAEKTADQTAEKAPEKIAEKIADPKPSDQAGAKPSPIETKPAAPVAKEEPKKRAEKLRFNFRYAPWKEVLDWFAQQADMSLVMEAPPPGTFNYSDDKEYSPAEAIDLINSVLLLKGYIIIRNERMLIVINKATDGFPPGLVQTITPAELDERGKFEIVCVVFNLDKLTPEEAEQEIKKMLGPDTPVVSLPKSRQIMVTDTGGRLRAIRSLIQRVEDPENVLSGQICTIELKQAPPEQVLPIVKQMLDIPDDRNVNVDGSLRLAIDPSGRRIIATGKPEKIARLKEIVEVVDVVKPGGPQVGIATTPQLEVYPVTTADPQSVLSVLQTLLQGQPDVNLALDPKTGGIIALARPADHATIRATLEQMQRDGRRMEVIRLRVVDPQLAVASINKLFGITGDTKTASTTAPQVDAEITTRQLLIHGTETQISQIRQLLEKMGESEIATADSPNESKVRMLSVSPRMAHSVLDQIQGIWPTTHRNKIREVTPSAVIPSMTPAEDGMPSNIPQHLLDRLREQPPKEAEPPQRGQPPKMPVPPQPPATPSETGSHEAEIQEPPSTPQQSDEHSSRTTMSNFGVKIRLAADERPALPPAAQAFQPLAASPENSSKTPATEQPEQVNPNAGAPIIISIGPGGVMIASEDTRALDEFEKLFTTLAGSAASGSPNMTIFYLKHAKAAIVAETLDQVFGGGTLQQTDMGGGGGFLGDLAGMAMGEAGGGLVGSLLNASGGGAIKPSGSVKITPDPRLNALLVQANPTDVDTIEQLLKILDQKESPEDVLIAPKPRMIPLYNTDAEKVAEIVKSTFQNRLESSGGQGGGQPNPQDLLQLLRGGRRGGGGGGRNQAQEIERMTVTADTRTNSLIVAASDVLFQDVKALVEELDTAETDSSEATRVISVGRVSADAIQSALQSIAGENVQFTRTNTGASRTRPGGPQQGMYQFGQGGRGGQFGGYGGGGRQNFGGSSGNYGGGGRQNFGGGGGNYGGGGRQNFGGGGGNRGGGNFGGGGNRGGGGGGGNRGGGGGNRGGGGR